MLKITVKDSSSNGEVFVRGLYGPKHIEYQIKGILKQINDLKKELRGESY